MTMTTTTNRACRCGHQGSGPHPCHGKAYTCGAPAKPRLVSTGPAALAGMQLKFSAYETWACDDCWQTFAKGK